MHDFGAIFGSLPLTRLARRRQVSRRQLEEEARASAQPFSEEPEGNLSEHIPSSLIPLEDRVRALAIGGAPAWSRRLKRIFDLTTALTVQLEAEWHALAGAPRMSPERFAAEWRRYAESVDFSTINELVERHNRYFPVEANLPMDVRTHDFVGPGGRDYRQQRLGPAWVLEHFPPDLAHARRAATQAVGAAPAGRPPTRTR